MIGLFETGDFWLMCKHRQLKRNTYYYLRRVPGDVCMGHKHPITRKPDV